VSRLLEHLRRQLDSSRRLLEIVISQSDAIRRQDVAVVLASLTDVQAEMAYRGRLEQERDALLFEAASERGETPETIDLDAMLVGAPAAEAAEARALSAELRGLLEEIGRIHQQNRILIRQELTFLDHLMRVLSGTPQTAYSRAGWAPAPATVTVVDARA
jgi:flagellar biosynthesis/type III secretory pathway chaperone